MKKIIFGTSICFVLFFSACEDNSTNGSVNSTSRIFPLALNNSWTYKVELYDSLGNIDTIRTVTVVISRDTIINGEKWYSGNSQFVGYANRSDGFYSYYEQPTLEYKYPASAGDSVNVTKYLTRRVISTNKAISVNGQNYSAYEYFDTYNTVSTQFTIYMVPNIGQVRSEMTQLNSKSQRYLSSRVDLISYKLY